jgi:adenosylmethionine-8-amino-7-oxononanoate aminotransferase
VFAHTIVDAPNHGASRRAAAISAPSDAAPTTAARTSMRRARTSRRVRVSSAAGASLPGTMRMTPKDLADLDRRHLWHPFTQQQGWMEEDFPIIESADDTTLYDTEGNAYIDGVSSLWCNVHGHRHPAIDIAIKDQLDRVAHSTMLGLSHAPAVKLAKRLVDLAPEGLSRVFFSDNGSTACEIALKMAYQWHHQRGEWWRAGFVCLRNSYHGDTLGSVSVGGI